MSRLIVLNGPPGIGKSTIAQRYVDDHPRVLDLDLDRLAELIGGWRTAFGESVGLARTAGLAMADAHLRGGHEVIVPQYVGRLGELERFEEVARGARAAFRHVVLMDSKASALERFTQRARELRTPWLRQVHEQVDRHGGAALLADMHDQLADLVRARLTSTLISCEPGEVEQTYRDLVRALDDAVADAPPPPRGVAVVVDAGRVLVIKRRRQGLGYAVLPGGGVERGESSADAAVRELREETSLSARIGAELWHRSDGGREATYFLMTNVHGTPMLSGSEAAEHSRANSFVLAWSTADELDQVQLQPTEIRDLLRSLLASPVGHDRR